MFKQLKNAYLLAFNMTKLCVFLGIYNWDYGYHCLSAYQLLTRFEAHYQDIYKQNLGLSQLF